tara:strand:+ start:1013 stop:1543 length:531 start_codon:yes stop_codon:yes gene_type:complete
MPTTSNRRRQRRLEQGITHMCDMEGCSFNKSMQIPIPCCNKKMCNICGLNQLRILWMFKNRLSGESRITAINEGLEELIDDGIALGINCPFCQRACLYERISYHDSTRFKAYQLCSLMNISKVKEKDIGFDETFSNNNTSNISHIRFRCVKASTSIGCYTIPRPKLEMDFVLNHEQ